MALQVQNFPIPIPWPWAVSTVVQNWTDQTLIDTNKFYIRFQAPKAGNISSLGFRIGGVVTTGGTLGIRLETTAAASTPTGVLHGTNTDGSIAVVSGDVNTWKVCTLNAPATVTKGQVLSIEGTISGTSASFQVSRGSGGVWVGSGAMPFVRYFTGGSWGGVSGFPALYATYDDTTEPMIWGAESHITGSSSSEAVAVNSESGIKFSLPFPSTLAGVWAHRFGPVTWRLYSSLEVLLASWTLGAAGFNSTGHGSTFYMFPTTYDLAANTDYYLVGLNSGGGSLTQATYPASRQDWKPWPLAYRATTGVSFTNTATKRPPMGPLVTAFDDGVGGSSLPLIGGKGLIL